MVALPPNLLQFFSGFFCFPAVLVIRAALPSLALNSLWKFSVQHLQPGRQTDSSSTVLIYYPCLIHLELPLFYSPGSLLTLTE